MEQTVGRPVRVAVEREDAAAGQDGLTTWLALTFIKISLVYFLIAAIWMGFSSWLPEPWAGDSVSSTLGQEIYNTARTHVATVGWLGFALIGLFYYLVPRLAGRPLHSARLARIHFWVTTAAVPLGVALVAYAGFQIGALLQTGVSPDQVMGSAQILPVLLAYLVVVVIGLLAQLLFIYNMFRTAG